MGFGVASSGHPLGMPYLTLATRLLPLLTQIAKVPIVKVTNSQALQHHP